MSEQKTAYSQEFQYFRELVKTAMFQAAADARELAERTGTKLVTREKPKSGSENTDALKELLAGVAPDNLHSETDWGKAQGKEEAW
jgi:antitoxin component of MazEF toxin-antitoxin module